mgnify:CR=1 FL=1
MSNKVLGDRGESCAARYLGAQGYRILAQKYRTKIGEIDLIAKDRDDRMDENWTLMSAFEKDEIAEESSRGR